ncbi:esterase [Leptolyngbya sp. 'hensonii']|nr:esterase [Leptolyngbya sp. 'hensonii']
MTLYTALWASRTWEKTIVAAEPPYRDLLFAGAGEVPLFGRMAIPERSRGTVIGTYGITGDLDNQWFLRLLGRKAFAQGYAVVLFDWRAHGKTAELSPTLTSDGLYEGTDFLYILEQASQLGCPAPFCFTGFSLGGQLALWGAKAAQERDDFGGAAVICPSLDSNRSLTYLEQAPLGKYLERAIAQELQRLAYRLREFHPDHIDPAAIERAQTIRQFDQELVIAGLGFPSVEAYYEASSALPLLPHLTKPTLILYAADDPLFSPAIVPDLQQICGMNPNLELILTAHGGHVGYYNSRAGQRMAGDADPWWAWNRVLQWWDGVVDQSR